MTGTGLSLGNHTSFFFDRNLKTSPFCIHRAESPIVAASGCPSTSFSPAPSAAVSRFRASKILRLGLVSHLPLLKVARENVCLLQALVYVPKALVQANQVRLDEL